MTDAMHDTETVLVVDDDPASIETIAALLKKAGYGVKTVASGYNGLEMARQIRPALILMDVTAAGMRVREFCTALTNVPDLEAPPVILVTANTTDAAVDNVCGIGMDFVCKPIRQAELLTRIRRLLELQRVTRQLSESEMIKGTLENAGAVCHSLNQPLQYVMGAIQILLMDTPPEDPNFEKLDKIHRKIEKIGDIAKKMASIIRYRTQRNSIV